VRSLVEREAAVLSAPTRARIAELILRDTVGLGPLEELMADPRVEEVMVNGPDEVYVERGGRIEHTPVRFDSERALRDAIERILTPLGRRIDELSPMVDARLDDGSRVNVVIPPLAVGGPSLSIRRFAAARPGPDEMIALGTLTLEARDLLEAAVRARRSILISGGTGSGKTTLLNALSSYIGREERVITIEDAAELALRQPHVVRLETRPASVEGRGEVTIRDLLRNALRMRPDRIVIGEVRGAEALDLLTALNTGHEGALSTLHANSPEDALRRLETLSLMAGVGLPHDAIRHQVARGIEIVAHLARRGDGSRRVVEIAEVVRVAGGAGVREVWRRGPGSHDRAGVAGAGA
jgi:pilus assembly protein CpaF